MAQAVTMVAAVKAVAALATAAAVASGGGGCGEGGGSRRWWRWQGLVWLPRWQKFMKATAFNRRVAW